MCLHQCGDGNRCEKACDRSSQDDNSYSSEPSWMAEEDDCTDSLEPSWMAEEEELAAHYLQSKNCTVHGKHECSLQLPRLRTEDIETGDILGSGSFCVVTEILRLHRRKGKAKEQVVGKAKEEVVGKGKDHNSRYAVKMVKKECLQNAESFSVAVIDLAMEAHFLKILDHSNIIKLHGLSVSEPATRSFFCVVDRLYETLEESLCKWKENEMKWTSSLLAIFKGQKVQEEKEKQFFERLAVVSGLADGLHHMHSRKIIHRDLKPDNIGFDARNNVKIFDFGFAKELTTTGKLPDGTYMLTGEIGTFRYMAPEVYHNQPYNETADVYSFALVVWEIFSLEKPYKGFDFRMMKTRVFEQGSRPAVNTVWPEFLMLLISGSWKDSLHDRTSAKAAAESLKAELVQSRRRDASIGICRDDDIMLSNDITTLDVRRSFTISFYVMFIVPFISFMTILFAMTYGY